MVEVLPCWRMLRSSTLHLCFSFKICFCSRVAITDYRGKKLVDWYVAPTMPVTDYRTGTTGITAAHLSTIIICFWTSFRYIDLYVSQMEPTNSPKFSVRSQILSVAKSL